MRRVTSPKTLCPQDTIVVRKCKKKWRISQGAAANSLSKAPPLSCPERRYRRSLRMSALSSIRMRVLHGELLANARQLLAHQHVEDARAAERRAQEHLGAALGTGGRHFADDGRIGAVPRAWPRAPRRPPRPPQRTPSCPRSPPAARRSPASRTRPARPASRGWRLPPP